MSGAETSPAAAEAELEALFLNATIEVQCLACGNTVTCELANPGPDPDKLDDVDDLCVECPTCTTKNGMPSVIPVVILVGRQVDALLAGVEVVDEPPPDGGAAAAPTASSTEGAPK